MGWLGLEDGAYVDGCSVVVLGLMTKPAPCPAIRRGKPVFNFSAGTSICFGPDYSGRGALMSSESMQ